MRESMAKKSPGSSNYSTLKDSYQSSGKRNQQKSESKSSKKYENQLKMQHSLKYQHQMQQECQQQPQIMNRTLSNFRAFQQQNTLNRSTSSNNIQKSRNQDEQSRSFINTKNDSSIMGMTKTGSTKNLNQHQMIQKSFLQSASQILSESQNKTPRASRNPGININTSLNTGSMTQRLTTASQQTPQNLTEQERLSLLNQRKAFDMKKQQLLQQLQQLNIMHIRELERIKKPSQLAYLTSRLVCQFFYLFNNQSSSKQLHMEDLIEWEQIQSHINHQVMKYFNELQQQIKIKLLNPEVMNNAQKEILEIKFTQLKEQYFTGDNLKIFKHINTNKNFQTIVNYILSVISYFIENKNQEQLSSNEFGEESKTFAYPGHNYDALITQRAQERKSSQIDLSATRTKSRNHNFQKLETTPTIISNKTQVNNDQTQNQSGLQKSASRSLLLRRDRSQLLQNNQQSINKSPLNRLNKDISFNKNQQTTEQSKNELSVSRKEKSFNASINNSARRPMVQSRSPINAHRKININNALNQTPTPSSRIAQKVQEFALKNSELLKNHEFTQDLSQEAPLDLDYKLMIESSGITAKIRESTAAIEQNMKYFQSPSSQSNIDMGLIEQIKQRRKEQLEREKSEERVSIFQSNKKLQEQL